jgi:hypothetical protein
MTIDLDDRERFRAGSGQARVFERQFLARRGPLGRARPAVAKSLAYFKAPSPFDRVMVSAVAGASSIILLKLFMLGLLLYSL